MKEDNPLDFVDRTSKLHWLIHKAKRAIEDLSPLDAAEALFKLQEEYPEILSAHCDDDCFMNSDIFFIPSMTEEELMGYNVIYCGQCEREIVEFFLYPNHVKTLLEACQAMVLMDEGRNKRK